MVLRDCGKLWFLRPYLCSPLLHAEPVAEQHAVDVGAPTQRLQRIQLAVRDAVKAMRYEHLFERHSPDGRAGWPIAGELQHRRIHQPQSVNLVVVDQVTDARTALHASNAARATGL